MIAFDSRRSLYRTYFVLAGVALILTGVLWAIERWWFARRSSRKKIV